MVPPDATPQLSHSLEADERWLPVVGFEDRYEVSDRGRMRALFERRTGNFKRGHIKRLSNDTDGYAITAFYAADGTSTQVKAHRVVLEAFVGPPPEGHQCRHLNGDPADNRLVNLRWGTCLENHADKRAHGTTPRGERNVNAKLTAEDVRQIRRLLACGEVRLEIAERFGVSRSTINHIAAGHTWAWLDGMAAAAA